jgi:hypothetical protein
MLPNSNQSPNVMTYLIIKKLKDLFSLQKRNILMEYSLLNLFFIFAFWRNLAPPPQKKEADWHHVFSFSNPQVGQLVRIPNIKW